MPLPKPCALRNGKLTSDSMTHKTALASASAHSFSAIQIYECLRVSAPAYIFVCNAIHADSVTIHHSIRDSLNGNQGTQIARRRAIH
eukprot:4466679-Amphidinium_carterae.2